MAQMQIQDTSADPHVFQESLSETDPLETCYYEHVVRPELVSFGLRPVDLRHIIRWQNLDIDFAGIQPDGTMVNTIEAKFDHMSALTGNFFLETTSVSYGTEVDSLGCFLKSKAQYFHQVSIMLNRVYISDLTKMRDYWYEDGDMPLISCHEVRDHVRRHVEVKNKTYKSRGDCVGIDMLFGERFGHYKHYLEDVRELSDDVLAVLVPQSDAILNKNHSETWPLRRAKCPTNVLQWLK